MQHGCESFTNQKDLDWALEHGWVRRPPEGYKGGFEISKIPPELVMERLRREEAKAEPPKKYVSQMNVVELQAECEDRGIDFTDKTKRQMRELMTEHDNSTNTDN